MKLSVSLPEEDVEFLDEWAASEGGSRSAVVRKAVRLLRASVLGPAYEEAWTEWEESPDGELWESAANDGLG